MFLSLLFITHEIDNNSYVVVVATAAAVFVSVDAAT